MRMIQWNLYITGEKMDVYQFDLESDGLHRHLAGGIPKGSTLLIEGDCGSGKSVVSQRLTYGFLSHDYSVTYISTELTTKGFIDQMNSLNYPILDFMLSEKLLFIPVFPLIGRLKSRDDFLRRFLQARELFENDIIIIDTFSSLVKEEINAEKALRVISFFKKLAGKSKTIIISLDPNDLEECTAFPFKSISDVYIKLLLALEEGSLTHTMFVNRFGTAVGRVGDTIGFRIEPGAGFIVDITTVA